MNPLRSTRVRVGWLLASWLLALPLAASAGSTPDPSPSATGRFSAYDTLQESLQEFVPRSPASGWPMKAHALVADPYKFWRGTKDLFARWSRRNCGRWFADRDAYYPAHGDLHLGNIGTYHADQFGGLAFGMVDFDEATRLPYQVELLSGLVTLELVAQVNGIPLNADERRALATRLVEQFIQAVKSPEEAKHRLEAIPAVRKLLDRANQRTYPQMLDELTENGRFKPVIRSGGGEVREILEPINDRKAQIASLLEQACWNDRRFASLVRYRKASEWQAAIRAVALRTRLGSSGSQGLQKVLVLVERPFKDADHDGVLYLKQQVLPATVREQRALSAFREPLPPTRAAEVASLLPWLCDPPPLFSSFSATPRRAPHETDVSFWVTVREPWSDELDHKDFKTLDDLTLAADIWALVFGRAMALCDFAHPGVETPEAREKLVAQLLERSAGFLPWLNQQYEQFRDDPRTADDVARAKAWIDSFSR